jgi:hypothetical protein
MSDIYGPRLAVASTATAMASTAPAAMASATVSAEAGMTGETVAKAAMVVVAAAKAVMESMVMVVVEVAKTAIVKIERAIDRIGVAIVGSAIVRLHSASGEEKTGADQEGYGHAAGRRLPKLR